jgi:hypothetical protein
MFLSDLPGELILEIADQLDDAGTSTLSRTNHRFYDLLNGYLYRRDLTQTSRSISLRYGDPEATVPRAIAAGRHLDPIPTSYDVALVSNARGREPQKAKLVVAQLLKVKGINPNMRHPNGDQLLGYLAFLGLTDVVKLFLILTPIR